MNDYKQKRLELFDEKFPCIETECNNNGSITGYDREGDAEQQQCQYCFEHRLPQKDFLAESIHQTEQELLKKILNIINVPEDEIVNVMEKAIRDNIIAKLT